MACKEKECRNISNKDVEWISKAAQWWHDQAISVIFKEGTMTNHHLLCILLSYILGKRFGCCKKNW